MELQEQPLETDQLIYRARPFKTALLIDIFFSPVLALVWFCDRDHHLQGVMIALIPLCGLLVWLWLALKYKHAKQITYTPGFLHFSYTSGIELRIDLRRVRRMEVFNAGCMLYYKQGDFFEGYFKEETILINTYAYPEEPGPLVAAIIRDGKLTFCETIHYGKGQKKSIYM